MTWSDAAAAAYIGSQNFRIYHLVNTMYGTEIKFFSLKKRKKGTSNNSDLKLTAETSVLYPDPV